MKTWLLSQPHLAFLALILFCTFLANAKPARPDELQDLYERMVRMHSTQPDRQAETALSGLENKDLYELIRQFALHHKYIRAKDLDGLAAMATAAIEELQEREKDRFHRAEVRHILNHLREKLRLHLQDTSEELRDYWDTIWQALEGRSYFDSNCVTSLTSANKK